MAARPWTEGHLVQRPDCCADANHAQLVTWSVTAELVLGGEASGGGLRCHCYAWSEWVAYSHSIVPGGLLVTSRVTRLICLTSLVIRVEIFSMTS
jgi:hypothetical protein